MSRFLPPPASTEHAFGIPAAGRDHEFSGQPRTLIQDKIPRRMRFAHGSTEARVPTPFSRAYLFYFGLNGGFLLPDAAQNAEEEKAQHSEETSKARGELLRRARGAFRGICALFALRDELQFDLELKKSPSFSDPAKQESVVYRMLARHLRADPHRATWEAPSYYVLRTATGTDEVVAGVSPLTGFFPAAKKLGVIPAAAYWYDSNEGWIDPGQSGRREWTHLDPKLQSSVRRMLSVWVAEVYQRIAVGARPMQGSLGQLGLAARDIASLAEEFETWRDELAASAAADTAVLGAAAAAVTCKESPIRSADKALAVPFFALACAGGIRSDVPSLPDGRMLITREDLLDPRVRLEGPIFGGSQFEPQLAALPLDGNNLGTCLGLDARAIKRPFVYLNKCFTPRLLQIVAPANIGLNREWKALTPQTAGGDTPSESAFLFPIVPEAVRYLPLDELSKAVTLAQTSQTSGRPVTLRLGAAQVTQVYGDPQQPEYTLDRSIPPDRFDLRVFPNLRLDEVGSGVLPAGSQDRTYFARLRLSPEWGMNSVPDQFLQPYGSRRPIISDEVTDIGSFTDDQGEVSASGKTRFIRFKEVPEAFYLHERGFCLVDLRHGPGTKEPPASWQIAVDFGTSNTCVAYRNRAVGNPEVLKLPMLTTSVQQKPLYGRIQGTDEGQSAMLDFFLYDSKETHLQRLDFFPSQVATRQETTPQRGEEGSLRNGMVVFKNFSRIILDQISVSRLLKDFAVPQQGSNTEENTDSKLQARFRIVQNIKWSDDTWMDVFMSGLRRHVVLAAAARNARVQQIIFSHPKSFSMHQVDNFESVLSSTWKGLGDAPAPLTLISESEGVRNYIARSGHLDPMVFDIGGGTTDVLAFRGELPFFQMSFKLAAGMVDRYVIASDVLRRQLSAAALHTLRERSPSSKLENLGFFKPAPLVDERLAPTPAMIRCQTVWHGLLSDVDETEGGMRDFARALAHNVYERAETSDEAREAIRGFFLSLLVTFGGLAYLGGMMNRAMRERSAREGGGMDNSIELSFIGNGGKYYELLENKRAGCAAFLQSMFTAGDGRDGREGRGRVDVKCVGVFESAQSETFGGKQPKAAIALGMLLDAQANAVPPMICNLIGENNFVIGEKMYSNQESLEDFYREMPLENRQDGNLYAQRSEDSAFAGFLAAMEDAAPGGMFGDSVAVPGMHEGWVEKFIEPLQTKIASRTRARLQVNAQLWQTESKRPTQRKVALEPVFVAELAALLEEIRESHVKR